MNTSGEYSLLLHFGSVLILFAFSLLGICLPLQHQVASALFRSPNILLFARAFGTGIVLATGFVHLLGHAYEHVSLVDLQGLTSGIVGLAALGGAVFVQFVEFVATRAIEGKKLELRENSVEESRPIHQQTKNYSNLEVTESNNDNRNKVFEGRVPTGESSFSKNSGECISSTQNLSSSHVTDVFEHCHSRSNHSHAAYIDHVLIHFSQFSDRHIVIIILEFGIAFHSFMIGTGLGVVEDKEFAAFFVTLSFHQFFEGMALGSVILQDLNILSWRFVLVSATIFSTMTPLGTLFGIILEGLGVSFFSSSLFRGLADAISAGVLIYTGLVELLTYQFTSSLEFRKGRLSIVLVAYLFMLFGVCIIMLISLFS
ncbi:Zinc transporter 1 [Galdieria sulphuraria]|uniref:Zinc transporter, ZIP family n=1 Tax=Galdieria sulphuraria TaxID=130081 RepID=M2XU04_GALSU|nr:zinc transporter, ZIP family [Galdieria sulphuraria]EME27148.1 zinc transporter, ZIP family [Galdieria sulphuraria]GJD09370.1 Zinc transporter 1 [Galdieria sulphuraria]|eukprot:XP_005703668.1 zinc transporter, ZIP family [Galdieria sulphuraria]